MRNALTQYKKTATSTNSRGQILLMLYDGAIRALEQARVAIEQRRPDLKGARLSRAHAVISELDVTLDHEAAPEMCQNLSALYRFMLDQITDANRRNQAEPLAVVIEILTDLRQSWALAVEQVEGHAPTSEGHPAPSEEPSSWASAPRAALSIVG